MSIGSARNGPGPLILVVGPTAAGKTDLAVHIARLVGGEIVNADAMSLYRGMDIGTAKPGPEERRGIAHHLFDVWDVEERASVVEYRALAREAIDDILRRGRVPLLVGGSGLYIRAVVDDMDFPATDPRVRTRLERECDEVGPVAMHERLTAVDPVAAAAILPGNARRIVRALEVIELTGRPFTASLPGQRPVYTTTAIGVDRPASLDERISRRVAHMIETGFVDEVRRLADVGLRDGETASRAVGYAQVLSWLRTGGGFEPVIADIERATRRLARRQRSWFRRDETIHWLDADRSDVVQTAEWICRNTIDP